MTKNGDPPRLWQGTKPMFNADFRLIDARETLSLTLRQQRVQPRE